MIIIINDNKDNNNKWWQPKLSLSMEHFQCAWRGEERGPLPPLLDRLASLRHCRKERAFLIELAGVQNMKEPCFPEKKGWHTFTVSRHGETLYWLLPGWGARTPYRGLQLYTTFSQSAFTWFQPRRVLGPVSLLDQKDFDSYLAFPPWL